MCRRKCCAEGRSRTKTNHTLYCTPINWSRTREIEKGEDFIRFASRPAAESLPGNYPLLNPPKLVAAGVVSECTTRYTICWWYVEYLVNAWNLSLNVYQNTTSTLQNRSYRVVRLINIALVVLCNRLSPFLRIVNKRLSAVRRFFFCISLLTWTNQTVGDLYKRRIWKHLIAIYNSNTCTSDVSVFVHTNVNQFVKSTVWSRLECTAYDMASPTQSSDHCHRDVCKYRNKMWVTECGFVTVDCSQGLAILVRTERIAVVTQLDILRLIPLQNKYMFWSVLT